MTTMTLPPPLICILNLQGHIKQVNEQWLGLLHLTSTQLLATAYHDWVHVEDCAHLEDALLQVHRTHLPTSVEIRWLDAQNQYHTLYGLVTFVASNTQFHLIALDITPIKQQAAQWQTLLSHLPFSLICLNNNGIVLFAQGNLLNKLGFNKPISVGSSVFDLSSAKNIRYEWQAALAGKIQINQIEIENCWFEWRYILINVEDDANLLVLITEITELYTQQKQAHELQTELKRYLTYASISTLTIDSHSIKHCNSRCEALLGYSHAELLKQPIHHLFPNTRQYLQLMQAAESLLKAGDAYEVEQWLKHKDDKLLYIKLTMIPIRYPNSLLWLLEDCTALKETTELNNVLWNHNISAHLRLNVDLQIIHANPMACGILGYTSTELKNKSLLDLDIEPKNTRFYQKMQQQVIQTFEWHGKINLRHKQGNILILEGICRIYTIHQHVKNEFILFFNVAESRYIGLIDPLTQLPNYGLLHHNLLKTHNLARRHKKRFALLLVNIDNLATINATQGYVVGDRSLQYAAQMLKASIRDSDTVARFNATGFMIVLEELKEARFVGMIAEMILFKIQQPMLCDGLRVTLSTSIGITVYPEDLADVDNLFEMTKTALRQAQRSGGEQAYFYNPTLQAIHKK